MLVISENLRGLVSARSLCPEALTEEFSLKIQIDGRIRRMHREPKIRSAITYGSRYDADDFFRTEEIVHRDIVLEPGDRILACSVDHFRMPPNYFGLVQTKGSLARLFVSATCNDGQVEPGFNGKITLEIMNHSAYTVNLPVGSNIAQLFVFRCTMIAQNPYCGRYQDATGPTVATFATD
jgi:deoxycytidine triphosphate deaminase